jgi:polyisoprenoid-binding protein YceI
MTNYKILCALSLCATACSGAGAPPGAAPGGKPVVTQSAVATPAATNPPTTASGTHYVQAASGNSLTFTFKQADAANTGSFRAFTTTLDYDAKNPAAGKLDVTVQIGSLATQDKDRDDTLRSADLLDAAKFPTAHYSAASFAKSSSGGLEAVGKLTLHGVTHDLRLPLQLRATAGGLELSGEVGIKRLDYGVGQGDWKSTEWVGDDVKLQYKVALKAG